jgi:hypothetical protein
MLQNPAWQATDDFTRAQLAMFHSLSDQIRLSQDDRRLALDLDDRGWMAWSDFMVEGRLPAEPSLPEMLLRLGETTYALSLAAEQKATSAR